MTAQSTLDLPEPVRTPVPDGLTDLMAAACLMRRGLEIVSEQGAWDLLPEAATTLFGAAVFPSMGSAARQVADIAQERDDERAFANKLAAIVQERDATIMALRAKLAGLAREATR